MLHFYCQYVILHVSLFIASFGFYNFVLAMLLATLLLVCHVQYAYLCKKNSVFAIFIFKKIWLFAILKFLRDSLFATSRIKCFDACL